MFKLMIHLEDLAEYEYIQKFNRNNIKFLKDSYVEEKFVRGIKIRKEISKNIYSIPLDVRICFSFLFVPQNEIMFLLQNRFSLFSEQHIRMGSGIFGE